MSEQLPIRDVTSGQRVLVVITVVVVTAGVAAFFAAWPVALLTGWAVGGMTFVAWVWFTVGGLTSEQTHALATREDNSRVGAQLLLVSASIASLTGTAYELFKASNANGSGKAFLTVLSVATLVASWGVVHTAYALRYAHEYYIEPVGGIDFKTRAERPDYQDFAYVAFTVGMTFQVSDTDIQQRVVRRTVLRHALLSYLFGAVILAVTVNTIATIFQ